MGSWRKVGAFLGLVPEDGHHYGPDGHLDDHELDYDGRYDYDQPTTQGALAMQPRLEVRRETEAPTVNRPVTVKLTGFAEARVVGEKYRDGQSVILDMTEMDDSDARRLVDFAAGLAFALRGSIDKVTTKVFMLLPSDDAAADSLLEDARRQAGW